MIDAAKLAEAKRLTEECHKGCLCDIFSSEAEKAIVELMESLDRYEFARYLAAFTHEVSFDSVEDRLSFMEKVAGRWDWFIYIKRDGKGLKPSMDSVGCGCVDVHRTFDILASFISQESK